MFFNSYTRLDYQKRDIIDILYYKTVKISRNEIFYEKLSVPDTIDGRYDLLSLFSIILIFHLSKCGRKGSELSQNLFDKIFLDLDLSLRELGAGDAGVHIKMKKIINSFMARQKVYCSCLEDHDFDKLKKHIIKNVYRNIENLGNSPDFLMEYCKRVVIEFKNKNFEYYLSNQFDFPKCK